MVVTAGTAGGGTGWTGNGRAAVVVGFDGSAHAEDPMRDAAVADRTAMAGPPPIGSSARVHGRRDPDP
jgi:hypothetical protein